MKTSRCDVIALVFLCLGFLAFSSHSVALAEAPSSLHLGWIWAPEGARLTSQVTSSNGTIYAVADDGTLYAVSVPGNLLWKYRGEYKRASAPLIATDGLTVYFVADGKEIYAVSNEGTLRWRFLPTSLLTAMPIIAPDGTMYVQTQGVPDQNPLKSSYDGYRLSPEGKAEPFTWPSWSSPTVHEFDSHGNMFLLSYGNPVIVSPEGNLLKECTEDRGRIVSLFVSGQNDTVFYARQNFQQRKVEIVAQKTDCSLVWKTVIEDLTEDRVYAVVKAGDQVLYVGGTSGRLYALDVSRGNLVMGNTDDQVIGSPISLKRGPDQLIYGVSERGYLFAFSPEGRLVWSEEMYEPGLPQMLDVLPGGDLVAIHAGKLKGFTADPALRAAQPVAVAPCSDRQQVEQEAIPFMLDFILREEIGATADYILTSGQLSVRSAPEVNLIVYGSIKNRVLASSSLPYVDEPFRVWSYSNSKLTEEGDKTKSIEEYRNRYMNDTTSHIWAYGYYDFGFIEIESDFRSAMIYMGARCGDLCGHGLRIGLRRSPSGQWWVSHYERLWQS